MSRCTEQVRALALSFGALFVSTLFWPVCFVTEQKAATVPDLDPDELWGPPILGVYGVRD